MSGFDTEMLKYTDIFIPNQHEAGAILGMSIEDAESGKEACRKLMERAFASGGLQPVLRRIWNAAALDFRKS